MTEKEKKLELVQWIVELEDEKIMFDLIELKKKAELKSNLVLSEYEIEGIRKGIDDIENNRTVLHDEVIKKIESWK